MQSLVAPDRMAGKARASLPALLPSIPPLLPLKSHHSLLFPALPPKSCGVLPRKPLALFPLASSPIPSFSQSLHPFTSCPLHFSACLSAFDCLAHPPILGDVVRFTTLSTTLPHGYPSCNCPGLCTALSEIITKL